MTLAQMTTRTCPRFDRVISRMLLWSFTCVTLVDDFDFENHLLTREKGASPFPTCGWVRLERELMMMMVFFLSLVIGL